MSKGPYWQQGVLRMLLLNEAVPGIGDRDGLQPSADAGFLYLSLHIKDPTGAERQDIYEIDYPGYARVAVPRGPGGFSVGGENPAMGYLTRNRDFPECMRGDVEATHCILGTDARGPGHVLFCGKLPESIPVRFGLIPRMTAASKVMEF